MIPLDISLVEEIILNVNPKYLYYDFYNKIIKRKIDSFDYTYGVPMTPFITKNRNVYFLEWAIFDSLKKYTIISNTNDKTLKIQTLESLALFFISASFQFKNYNYLFPIQNEHFERFFSSISFIAQRLSKLITNEYLCHFKSFVLAIYLIRNNINIFELEENKISIEIFDKFTLNRNDVRHVFDQFYFQYNINRVAFILRNNNKLLGYNFAISLSNFKPPGFNKYLSKFYADTYIAIDEAL